MYASELLSDRSTIFLPQVTRTPHLVREELGNYDPDLESNGKHKTKETPLCDRKICTNKIGYKFLIEHKSG